MIGPVVEKITPVVEKLKAVLDKVVAEPLPPDIAEIVQRLDNLERKQ